MATSLSLRSAALRMLAQREQSVSELRRKLLQHASKAAAGDVADRDADAAALPRADEIEQVIAWLLANGHLSEERFVESRVHARAPRFGNLRIRAELSRHGVQLPDDAAAALAASELQRAFAIWQRKYGCAPADARERAKQMRFLSGRGFSASVIGQLMRRCEFSEVDGG